MTEAAFYHPVTPLRCKLIRYAKNLKEGRKSYSGTADRGNYDHICIDKRQRPRTINPKKLSRKKKVNSVFLLLCSQPNGSANSEIRDEVNTERIWSSLETLPPTRNLWDDLVNVAVELRLNKQWDPVVSDDVSSTSVLLIVLHSKTCSLNEKISSRFASGFSSRAPSTLM